MPKVRATLPERYAVALLCGILSSSLLFLTSTFLLIGIIQGSAPEWVWLSILVAEGLSVITGVILGILYWHDRALMRNPQKYRGELA